MSRGHGEMQQLLLKILERHKNGVPLPTLIWMAAADDEGVSDNDDMPAETYKRLHAAARRLRRSGSKPMVVARKQRIASLDELVRLYPDRTKDSTVRQLRRTLLPLISDYAAHHDTRRRQRSAVSVEEWALRDHLSDDAIRQRFAKAWSALEREIVRRFPRFRTRARTSALELLVRGNELAGGSAHVTAGVTLSAAISHMRAVAGRRNKRLLAVLDNMKAHLPVRRLQRADLKAVLRSVVHLDKGQPVRLKQTFKQFLRDNVPDVLTTLPGHFERQADVPWLEPEITFDPVLDRLILRDALQAFDRYFVIGG